MKVAVVGAGVGGLTLAQGLLRAGIDVTVYERDTALDSRGQGYRIHLHALAALEACLPSDLYELCIATAGQPSTQLTVMSSGLRILRSTEMASTGRATSVNRQTFREILAARLEGVIEFGRTCVGFTQDPDIVRVQFADGTEASADVLVAADGVGSPIRRQYLPQLMVEETGALCIYGRTPLTDQTRPLVPPSIWKGFTAIVGGKAGMATGVLDFREAPGDAARRIAPDVRLSEVAPYLMWALTAQADVFPNIPNIPNIPDTSAGLHEVAAHTIRRWHPDVRRLVELAAVEETTLIPIRSAVPIDAWPSSRVTLLGDAVHAMSPARGSGANTALQDAALLAAKLAGAVRGDQDVVAAIAAYEREMIVYGFEAVRASREAGPAGGSRLRSSLFRRLAGIR
ncbi:2-polyprenyl-6-methoxyphenol hydroxylase-like FAD-dependent oxidoreductase [Catenulispora sp. GAS73]|uniref:FAD-dependent oxidoreductase n=1 Tax=Catenulispora sp. GAS73 TaxID=3156269 RepID=UPI003513BA4B